MSRAKIRSGRVLPAIRAADAIAQRVSDGLMGSIGRIRYWKSGSDDPDEAEAARRDWTRLCAYADAREGILRSRRKKRRRGKRRGADPATRKDGET